MLQWIRRRQIDRLNNALMQNCQRLSKTDMRLPTLVVAPHPDDETLGCGGLIAAKCALGVAVSVVFVSDGASSHVGMRSAEVMKLLREDEARAACEELGVSTDSIFFLDFPDGQLSVHVEAISNALIQLCLEKQPQLIVTPHAADPPPDHLATHHATVAVARKTDVTVQLEYAVWYWHRWPWTSPYAKMRVWRWRQIVQQLFGSSFGRTVLQDFNHYIDHGCTKQKRTALARHQTQVTHQEPNWPILADVAGGDWLKTLLEPFEYFRRTDLNK